MGHEYRLAYQVSYLDSGGVVDGALLLCGGLLGLMVLGVIGRGLLRGEQQNAKALAIYKRIVIGALVFTAFSAGWFGWNLHEAGEMIGALRIGRCQTVEGVVHVVHQQPWDGHGGGDVIRIGEKEFSFSFYDTRPGYHQTIAHSGVLVEGAFARVHYRGNTILQVELR